LECLERTDLTFNERNCVLFRSGEKKILKFLISLADHFIPALDMKFKDAKKALANFPDAEVCKEYINTVLLNLVKKGI